MEFGHAPTFPFSSDSEIVAGHTLPEIRIKGEVRSISSLASQPREPIFHRRLLSPSRTGLTPLAWVMVGLLCQSEIAPINTARLGDMD